MSILHKEFSFKVVAPEKEDHCAYYGCKETKASYAVLHEDDRGTIMFYIDPVCEKHILSAFIDALYDKE